MHSMAEWIAWSKTLPERTRIWVTDAAFRDLGIALYRYREERKMPIESWQADAICVHSITVMPRSKMVM